MRRDHHLYGRTRYLTDPTILAQIGALHREHATRQARQIGLLNPDGEGSWTHPDLGRILYADGKVVTPLFRAQPGDRKLDKTTGEIKPLRFEPDASLHHEGTGQTAWGTKFVIVACRDHATNARVILDGAFVPGANEAAVAGAMFERLTPLTVGAQAVVYDTALRGVHHQHLMRQVGLMTVNRVAAAAGSRQQTKKNAKRIEKSTFVETRTITTTAGERSLTLFALGGRIGLGELTETGEVTFVPLEQIRTHRSESKAGTFRWYNDCRLPAECGGGTGGPGLRTV